MHTFIEEAIFYPAVAGKVEDDLMDESHVEHDTAKALIAPILAGQPSDAFYDAKVTVPKEVAKHHVKEEEQRGGLFTQALKSKADMVAMRAVLEAKKAGLTAQYERQGIPTPMVRALGKSRVKVGRPVAWAARSQAGAVRSAATARAGRWRRGRCGAGGCAARAAATGAAGR